MQTFNQMNRTALHCLIVSYAELEIVEVCTISIIYFWRVECL